MRSGLLNPQSPQYRHRAVDRDARRSATAIENLRVGLLKLAVRDEKARAAEDGLAQHAGMARILALREAARLLGMALGELDLVRRKQ